MIRNLGETFQNGIDDRGHDRPRRKEAPSNGGRHE